MKSIPNSFRKLFIFSALLCASLTALAQHTLTNAQVEVVDGEITSCSYDFSDTDIIIPGSLDGQTVTAIGDNVFYAKGITSVDLSACTSLQTIGANSFSENFIDSIDFSIFTSLERIGYYAFSDNSFDTVDLSSNTSLVEIASGAFERNDIIDVNLNGCSSLLRIGRLAFSRNEITSVDLTGCTLLNSISDQAFYMNYALSSIDLSQCTALSFIGEYAFETTNLASISLPINASYNPSGWRSSDGTTYLGGSSVSNFLQYYVINHQYILASDDVEVVDGIIQSCSYNFALKDIYIPIMLDGQFITGIAGKAYNEGIFQDKDIVSVELPTALTTIGQYAFSRNAIDTLDLNSCTGLLTVGLNAFDLNAMDTLMISECSSLTTIGQRAFSNNNLNNLSLANCTSLELIDLYAFINNEIENIDFSNCTAISNLGYGSFRGNDLDDVDLSPCTALTLITSGAFYNNPMTEFTLPTPNVPGLELRYWEDDEDNTYPGGTATTNFNTTYTAVLSNSYQVEFAVTDGTNPIEGAKIKLMGYDSVYTNASGIAVLDKVFNEASIYYTVTQPGYTESEGFITVVDDNITESVVMDLDSYDVIFVVSYGVDPMEGATVWLDGHGTLTTDVSGLATFTGVALVGGVNYTVNQTGYDEVTGTVSTDDILITDAPVDVRLVLSTYDVSFTVTNGVDPVEDATVSLTGYGTSTTDASGEAMFIDIEPATDMDYSVTATGYNDISGTVTVSNDDVIENVTLTATVNILSSKTNGKFSIYPNPASEVIYVLIEQESTLNLYDMLGKELINIKVFPGSNTIALHKLEPGQYNIVVKLQGEIIHQTLIVQ